MKKWDQASQLRKEQTQGEKIMWSRLRRDRLGARFRRQACIGPYILDFYCRKADVAVEVDGELHDPIADARRDAVLESQGIITLRIKSWDVFSPKDLDAFVDTVWHTVHGRLIQLGVPNLPEESEVADCDDD